MISGRTSTPGWYCEQLGHVLVVRLDRPPRQNALTPSIVDECTALLRGESSWRSVVISGGGGHFCSGYDLDEFVDGNHHDMRTGVASLMRAIEDHPVPVIAAVSGNCIGAGFELALACDFRVADSTARFVIPPAKLGIVYPWEGVARLVASVGPAMARYMLYTAAPIASEQALRIGIIQELARDEEAAARAVNLAEMIAEKRAPLSVRGAKLAISTVSRLQVDAELAPVCDQLVDDAFASSDHKAALDARHDRKEPQFEGK